MVNSQTSVRVFRDAADDPALIAYRRLENGTYLVVFYTRMSLQVTMRCHGQLLDMIPVRSVEVPCSLPVATHSVHATIEMWPPVIRDALTNFSSRLQ